MSFKKTITAASLASDQGCHIGLGAKVRLNYEYPPELRTRGLRQGESLTVLGARIGQVRDPAEQDLRCSAGHELVTGYSGKNQFNRVPRHYRCNVAVIPINL